MGRNITADLLQRFIQFVRVGPGLPTILDTPRILPSTLLSLFKAVVLAIPALSVLFVMVFQMSVPVTVQAKIRACDYRANRLWFILSVV